jgi:hypothetical protein
MTLSLNEREKERGEDEGWRDGDQLASSHFLLIAWLTCGDKAADKPSSRRVVTLRFFDTARAQERGVITSFDSLTEAEGGHNPPHDLREVVKGPAAFSGANGGKRQAESVVCLI